MRERMKEKTKTEVRRSELSKEEKEVKEGKGD